MSKNVIGGVVAIALVLVQLGPKAVNNLFFVQILAPQRNKKLDQVDGLFARPRRGGHGVGARWP